MKISIIGPGIMPIPPEGWGGVEILIWDYTTILRQFGHDVQIVNTPNYDEIKNQVNSYNPDFVHLHYDVFWEVMKDINCQNKAMTSHFGYIEQDEKNGWYMPILNGFLNSNCHIFSLSPGIAECYVKRGLPIERSHVTPNGARKDLIRFEKECEFPNKTIFLGKVECRKRQSIFMHNQSINFVGKCVDTNFNMELPNFLGEWNKLKLYNDLTKYANLILLSDGECHPAVCSEGLMAGLGLVLSEYAIANLDISKDFIDVIPEDKINNIDYVNSIIDNNRKKSLILRNEIREYALKEFDYENKTVPHYLNVIKETFGI